MDRHSLNHRPNTKTEKADGSKANGDGKFLNGANPLEEKPNGQIEIIAASLFSKEEWREMAQAIVDEKGLHSGDELATQDWEVYSGALVAGVIGSLRFKEEEKPVRQAVRLSEMNPEEMRKANLKSADIDNCTMFKLIMVECFHIGTGRPVVGVHRTTQLATLQNPMNRKLPGPQHREFKRCWERMASEGVVQMTKDKNAAHLNVTFDNIRDPDLKKAVTWAIREQMKVSPEWRGRYEQMFKA